jgi:hypothetical protein
VLHLQAVAKPDEPVSTVFPAVGAPIGSWPFYSGLPPAFDHAPHETGQRQGSGSGDPDPPPPPPPACATPEHPHAPHQPQPELREDGAPSLGQSTSPGSGQREGSDAPTHVARDQAPPAPRYRWWHDPQAVSAFRTQGPPGTCVGDTTTRTSSAT